MILNEGFDLLIEELLEENAKNDFINKFGEETFNKFEKAKQRLKNNNLSTDYQQYLNMSEEELLKLLADQYDTSKEKDLQKLRQNQDTGQEIRGEYKYLGEAGGYKVYQPLDYLASMDLGVNTGWCTTGRYQHAGKGRAYVPSAKDAKEHFEDYTSKGIKLYYFLDPATMFGKYAIAVSPKVFDLLDMVEYEEMPEDGWDDDGHYIEYDPETYEFEDPNHWWIYNLTNDGENPCYLNYEIFDDQDNYAWEAVDKLPVHLIPEKLILEPAKLKSAGNKVITTDNVFLGLRNWDWSNSLYVDIPEGITAIRISGRYNKFSNILGISIPASVTEISGSIGKHSLKRITVDPNNKFYDSRNNCNAIIETKTNKLILGCETTVIPNGVTCIGTDAFEGSGIQSVKLPSSVTTLENSAFLYCNQLKEVVIPATVKTVGPYSFASCHNLESVKFLGADTILENNAFYRCENLKSVELPSNLKEIPNEAFRWCDSLTQIKFPAGLQTLGNEAFERVKLTDIYIPATVTKIEQGLFDQSQIKSIVVDPENPVYDSRGNCNAIIETATNKLMAACPNTAIPQGIKILGPDAFCGVENAKIVIPNSVETIYGDSFYQCNNVEVVVPDSVKEILPEENWRNSSYTPPPTAFTYNRYFKPEKPLVVITKNPMVIDYCKKYNVLYREG